jgi:hypothetical protein
MVTICQFVEQKVISKLNVKSILFHSFCVLYLSCIVGGGLMACVFCSIVICMQRLLCVKMVQLVLVMVIG